MDKIEKPFWEATYSKEESASTFNDGKPSWDVVEVLEKHLHSGKVLDLGCGDGRNALYAASLGYEVTAVDISNAGISKLNDIAKKRDLSVEAIVQDMRNFRSEELFNVVISHGCLHLLYRDEWMTVLHNIKAMTAPDGLNIVVVFTDKVPPSPDMKPFTKGLFKEGELFDQYSGWTIHHQSSHVLEDDHGNGIHHVHAVNRIIAQKTTNKNYSRDSLPF
jgi:tellurite methyltransferase